MNRDVIADLAPAGRLRAAINVGNPVLAQRDDATGALGGVSVDLARELARRLGAALELVPYPSAGAVFASIAEARWDLAFLAIDPVRAEQLRFTPPYAIIEGGYLVRDESAFRSLDAVDADGVRIAVGKNAAYDLYLSRHLQRAELVREATSRAAIDAFVAGATDVAAGIRSVLVAETAAKPGLRVLDGAFMTIRQAVAAPSDRVRSGPYLDAFVHDAVQSGFVAAALARSGQTETAAVASP